jgi:hypothetical protein
MPYVFSVHEMTQIFEAADDLIVTNKHSKTAAELPMLLRILYGCGLRLGDGYVKHKAKNIIPTLYPLYSIESSGDSGYNGNVNRSV